MSTLYVFLLKIFFVPSASAYPIEAPHEEYFIDNSDVIGHKVWQQYWIKETKKLGIVFSETTQRKKLKLGLCHQLPVGYIINVDNSDVIGQVFQP